MPPPGQTQEQNQSLVTLYIGYKIMTKTIVLTDLIVKNVYINYEEQNVRVIYKMVDETSKSWQEGTAYFWVTMPENPTVNDFQLPTGYIPTLVQLQTDADQALTSRFLI